MKLKKIKFDADSRKKLLIVGIIFLVLIIGFMVASYFVGQNRLTNYGYDTPEAAVQGYIVALNTNNQMAIRDTLYPNVKAYDSYVQVSDTIAGLLNDSVTLSTDSITLTSEPYDIANLDTESFTDMKDITSATAVNAVIPVQRQIEGETFDFNCTTTYITVQNNGKWYVASANLTPLLNIVFIREDEYKLTIYGNSDFGYFYIPQSWTEESIMQGDFPEYAHRYTASDGRASIMTSMYLPSKSMDAIADDLVNNALTNLDVIEEPLTEDRDENGQHIKTIVIVYNDNGTECAYIIRLMTSPLHDNNIHVIEITGKADGIEEIIPYANTLTFEAPTIEPVTMESNTDATSVP